jgi:putative transposase
MRNRLRRYYGRGDLHFITFSCYRRRPLLGSVRARCCFTKVLDVVRSRYKFLLLGYVVMPEHVHLLISEPQSGNPSKVLQVLKQNVSSALRVKGKRSSSQLQLPFSSAELTCPFWQRRFYDFNVWSEKKVREKLDYMHRNPVQRQLVRHPKEWPWSSWSYYSKGERGLIRIDSLEDENDKDSKAQRRKRQNPHP